MGEGSARVNVRDIIAANAGVSREEFDRVNPWPMQFANVKADSDTEGRLRELLGPGPEADAVHIRRTP